MLHSRRETKYDLLLQPTHMKFKQQQEQQQQQQQQEQQQQQISKFRYESSILER